MKNRAFTCKSLVVNDVGTEGLVSLSDPTASEPRLGSSVGIPLVRNKDGVVVWKPVSATCRFWSIEGGGTVAAKDGKGRLVAAYRLKPGETVDIT